MRFAFLFTIMLGFVLVSCDETRVAEQYQDLDNGEWMVANKPSFQFDIQDTTRAYNIYCNLRNDLDYPWSRIFVTYVLSDSSGKTLSSKMVEHMLFDRNTGEPQGSSGIGDLHDHQVPLLMQFRFPSQGKFSIAFEQMMRTDTLAGIHAVGFRVEQVGK